MALRIAFITDIHFGPDFGAKKGSQAPVLIDSFIDAAHAFGAQYIITGGDDISSRDPDTDEQNKRSVADLFNRAACPVLKVKGNHCDRFQTTKSPSQIIDTGDHQIVIWNPNLNNYTGDGIIPDPEDIHWLQSTLAGATKPVLILSHIPFGGPESEKKILKRENSTMLFYPSHFAEEEQLRAIIESSGKAILCLSGHRHLNDIRESNSVHYVIHQSLVEMIENDQPAAAFSMIEIDSTEIRIHGHGLKQPPKTFLPLTSPAPVPLAA